MKDIIGNLSICSGNSYCSPYMYSFQTRGKF